MIQTVGAESRILHNTGLSRTSYPGTEISSRVCKHNNIRNLENDENRIKSSHLVDKDVGKYSTDIPKVLVADKYDGVTDTIMLDKNIFCFPRNILRIQQNWCQRSCPFYTNFGKSISHDKTTVWPNVSNVDYQLFLLHEIYALNLKHASSDRCENERVTILQSNNKKKSDSAATTNGEFSSDVDFNIFQSTANTGPTKVDSIMVLVTETEVGKQNYQCIDPMFTDIYEENTIRCKENKNNFENRFVLPLPDPPSSIDGITNENALDIFLFEEEFDDDSIIMKNMNLNGNIELLSSSQSPSFSVPSSVNLSDNFETACLSSEKSVSSISRSSLNSGLSDDGFLNAISTLNSKLGDLIRSCRSMSSELKGILRDMK